MESEKKYQNEMVKYLFSEEELKGMAEEMARKYQDKTDKEDEKKRSHPSLKHQLKHWKMNASSWQIVCAMGTNIDL